jgi:hypothetical protein
MHPLHLASSPAKKHYTTVDKQEEDSIGSYGVQSSSHNVADAWHDAGHKPRIAPLSPLIMMYVLSASLELSR